MSTEFKREGSTPFDDIYNSFFGKITDDMYMELTQEETKRDVKSILLDSLMGFEFPRFSLFDLDEENEQYNLRLTKEEIDILACLMLEQWLQRQITSVEVTRMKYTGAEFKMTSQANHLAKLMDLQSKTQQLCLHKQRLYKRRTMIDEKGIFKSNWSVLGEISTFDG